MGSASAGLPTSAVLGRAVSVGGEKCFLQARSGRHLGGKCGRCTAYVLARSVDCSCGALIFLPIPVMQHCGLYLRIVFHGRWTVSVQLSCEIT